MLLIPFFIWVFFLGVPILLTLWNIALLFIEKKKFVKVNSVKITDITTFTLGISFTALLADFSGFEEWYVQLYNGTDISAYTPISFESMPTFITLCAVAVAGYVLLRFFGKRLSPVIASLCYSGMFLGFCLTAALTVQFWSDIRDLFTFLFLLFPYNYVLCSVRLMRNTVAEYAAQIAQRNYDNRFLQLCKRIVSKSASLMIVSFVLAIPLLFVIIVILLLFGQQPDSVIKMFTETAEWTLSQKIPPPRLDYTGHYLCTVAACGDEKIVKPLRAGKRYGELIVVNRQLLVANAFEDLIAERTPRVHRLIRKTYDKYGLPISKHITTKRRSNVVYLLMKPLEWLFVAMLYTFDTKPENRIHRQYVG